MRRKNCRFEVPTLHINPASVVIWMVQCLFLLGVSRTAGVTHWKLIDDAIIPEPLKDQQDLPHEEETAAKSEGSNWYTHSSHVPGASDPEFALIIRYSARTSGGGVDGSSNNMGSANRGTGVHPGGFTTTRRHASSVSTGLCRSGGDVKKVEISATFGRGASATLANNGGRINNQCQQQHHQGSGGGGEMGGVRQPRKPDGSGMMSSNDMAGAQPSPLTCGEPVEHTVYDFLKGIARRSEHKMFPEPEVAMIFKKSENDNTVDLFDVEMGLRKAYQENPESLTVLNQIGNFWRIKGNTQYAIECFRKALYISSDHPDLLLNLARVLFNLKFYDDAIFLAKRSLHMKGSDSHAWLQYFTLGEVYKALEKYEEAVFYFKKSLEKNPSLHVAEMHLRELGLDQKYSVNTYTVVIIFVLIMIVIAMIYFLFIGAIST